MTPLADGNRTVHGPATGRADTPGAEPVRLSLTTEDDLLAVRHAVRFAAVAAGFSIIDQTRVITAASELARNAYIHGGGGDLVVGSVHEGARTGLRLTISDRGPGIPDVEAALADGYSTGVGLGHGLGGARRLMDEFEVRSTPGEGTTVITTRWRR
ncbi:serine/threonine protein kinase [Streptomyces cirratus]|uniref:Serine/threonine protein kinase n=1 Tax=Streptomyces cirratus TaxID=68187 RepID=A0ABQ3EQI5_9ACTN|nr:anti-sigma regulatory factor [Streptomyces cirratus]GHB51937.1 serine/threonine protein kinase [Streptomyces cirratus]